MWLVLGILAVPTCGDRTLPDPSLCGKVPILGFTVVNLRRRQGIRQALVLPR